MNTNLFRNIFRSSTLFSILTSAILLTGAASCSKSKSSNNGPATKTVSIKISVSPVPGNNQGSFTGTVTALLPNNSAATWKVNGTARGNENVIAFSQTDLQNGVITLETTAAVTMAALDVSGVTTAQNPFNITVVPTINGQALATQSLAVTSTLVRSFQY